MSNTNISIAGIAGRMGRTIARACSNHANATLVNGFTEPADPLANQPASNILSGHDFTIAPSAKDGLTGADVLIDFTAPAASLNHIEACKAAGAALVIGTTGFTASEEALLVEAGQHIPVLKSGNMSLGVNLLAALVKQAAARLDQDYDIEIFEAHHRHKVDAPSGTALLLGEAAAEGRNATLSEKAVHSRDGITGAREPGSIGFSVLRSGGIIGDHDVSFGAEEEIITLSHRALDRSLFAKGAVAAAIWLSIQRPGFYGMQDLLNLS